MMPRLAPLLLILSVIFLCRWTYGEAGSGLQDGVWMPEPLREVTNPTHERTPIKVISSRKLVDMTLDYDDGGPNRKHDPSKGKPGIGSKGP